MTIHGLKVHLDRRFDRLERTKADRTELRRFRAKSDRRWAATRRAFRRFATKDDFKRFATKDDLKRYATKHDLKGFATKADIARLEERVVAMHRTIQQMLRHHGHILDNHEERISDFVHNWLTPPRSTCHQRFSYTDRSSPVRIFIPLAEVAERQTR